MKAKVIGIILVVVILLQFFRGSAPEVTVENPNDLIATAELSGDIAATLRAACYDCHSMETKYPWYSYITPVSWFLFHHIDEGRDELNFSEWAAYSKRDKLRKLKDIQEEVEEGEMPMESYVIMHSEASLTEEQREAIVTWAKNFAGEVIRE